MAGTFFFKWDFFLNKKKSNFPTQQQTPSGFIGADEMGQMTKIPTPVLDR